MKKWFFKCFELVTFIIVVVVVWYLFFGDHTPHKTAFKVSSRIASYSEATEKYFDAKLTSLSADKYFNENQKSLEEKNDTAAASKIASNQKMQKDTEVFLQKAKGVQIESEERLNKSLDKAVRKYGDVLRQPVDNLKQMNTLVFNDQLTKEDVQHWKTEFNEKSILVKNQLKEVTGLYDVDSPEVNERVANIVEAKEKLKNYPNDPRLCSVMQSYPGYFEERSSTDQKLRAQRVAFIDEGEQYCSDYYHKRSMWGALGKSNSDSAEDIPYSALSYTEYYRAYLAPEAKKLVEHFKDKPSDDPICRQDIFESVRRDPKQGAFYVAFQMAGDTLCPERRKNSALGYEKTSMDCVFSGEWKCEGSKGPCDIIERCKPSSGPIFDDQWRGMIAVSNGLGLFFVIMFLK